MDNPDYGTAEAPIRPTPATVRRLAAAAETTAGLFAVEAHRHYFLRVEERETTQGNRVTKRYVYKCVCGQEVS